MSFESTLSPTQVHLLEQKAIDGILVYRKRLGFYPEGHPRLVEALKALQVALVEHEKETGLPLTLSSAEPVHSASSTPATKAPINPEVSALRRTLQRLLVRSLTVEAGATPEELRRLCTLLAQDTPRAERDHTPLATPKSSAYVHFASFSEDDSRDDLTLKPSSVPVSQVENAVKSLPADLQDAVYKAIEGRGLLGRLTVVRDVLCASNAPDSEGSAKRINLLGTLLERAFNALERSPEGNVDQARVEMIVESTVSFLEEKAQQVSDATNSPGQDSSLGGIINEQKQKLEFLFKRCSHTNPKGAPKLPEAPIDSPAASGPEKKSPPAPCATPDPGAESAPLAGLPEIQLSPGERQEVLRDATPYQNFCKIVFEVLSRDVELARQPACWPALIKPVIEAAPSEAQLENALSEALELINDRKSEAAERFLGELMAGIQQPAFVGKMLDDFVLRCPGFPSSATLLRHIEEKNPKLSFTICQWLHKNGRSGLKTLAESKLLSRTGTLDGLLRLIQEAPDCLLQPRVLGGALLKHKDDDIFAGFKQYFARANEGEADRIFRILSDSIHGAGEILGAAMESSNPALRVLAIANLWRAGTSRAFRVIEAILVKNNLVKSPHLAEVEAAADSLLKLQGETPENLRRKILGEKSFFRHTWRKGIRKALTEAAARRQGGFSC